MMARKATYIHALSFSWLTPFYDPLLKWGMRETIFKREMIQKARIQPGMRVLDLGCGTGTLTIMLKQTHPEAEVVGLDGDPQVLEIASEKTIQAGVTIKFDRGMVYQLPYPANSFDRVLSSLVFHHLTVEDKLRTLHEIYRVLRHDGEVYIVDFGKPRGFYTWLISLVMRKLERAKENIQGLIPDMMRKAGFHKVEEPNQFATIVGGLSLFQAKKENLAKSPTVKTIENHDIIGQ